MRCSQVKFFKSTLRKADETGKFKNFCHKKQILRVIVNDTCRIFFHAEISAVCQKQVSVCTKGSRRQNRTKIKPDKTKKDLWRLLTDSQIYYDKCLFFISATDCQTQISTTWKNKWLHPQYTQSFTLPFCNSGEMKHQLAFVSGLKFHTHQTHTGAGQTCRSLLSASLPSNSCVILVRVLPSLLCVCSAAVMTVVLEMCPAGPHKPLPRAEEIPLIFLRGVWPFKLINHSRCANRRERKHKPRTRFLFLSHKTLPPPRAGTQVRSGIRQRAVQMPISPPAACRGSRSPTLVSPLPSSSSSHFLAVWIWSVTWKIARPFKTRLPWWWINT